MAGRRPVRFGAAATAFAPGHLSLVFSPRTAARDPRARGSVGAGLLLELGVRVRARAPGRRTGGLQLESDLPGPNRISEEVARRLLAGHPTGLDVEIRHELPVGQGFGMSAASAAATGLAVARILSIEPGRAWETAHLADLFGRGGLGGVAAIRGGGGWEVRLRPGIGARGRVVHGPFRRSVLLAIAGSNRPSPELLGSPAFLRRVERAAAGLLEPLGTAPSERELLAAGERFTDRLRLGPRRVLEHVRQLRRAGCWAGQTMFGSALWAVAGSDRAHRRAVAYLHAVGTPALELRAAVRGARCTGASIG